MESMARMILTLHPGTTHLAQLLHLVNSALPGFITTALALLTLRDEVTEAPLLGITWPVTMAAVAYSEGDYEVTLPATLAITVGQRVIFTAIVVADGGAQRTFIGRCLVTEG